MIKIYADNAATTKMSKRAQKAYTDTMRDTYGNPSSVHSVGMEASEKVFAAREKMARLLGCNTTDIYFNSGGTEGANQALLSAALNAKKRGKNHVITTPFEHHAVLSTVQRLKKYGFKVTYVDVHEDGLVYPEDIEAAMTPKTAAVSVMFANNELGTVQPIREIGEVCRRHRVLFHTDAVQAVGHLPINIEEYDLDFLTLSAHKFHGPKGVGVLVARNRVALSSLVTGGRQERGRRAGTENVPGIVSMAEALEESLENLDKKNAKTQRLRDRIMDGLLEVPGAVLNGDREKRLPGNINVSFDGVEGEPLVLMLDTMGIAVSTGSACTSGSVEPSHVLLAIGRSPEEARRALRITVDCDMTFAEADTVVSSVKAAVAKLRELSEASSVL